MSEQEQEAQAQEKAGEDTARAYLAAWAYPKHADYGYFLDAMGVVDSNENGYAFASGWTKAWREYREAWTQAALKSRLDSL